MAKRVTIAEIAAECQLAVSSVSMILNHKNIKRFHPETVELVFNTAHRLGYKKKGKEINLSRTTSSIIVVVCPSLTNPFYTTLIQGIEMVARASGFTTSVRTTYWDTKTEKLIIQEAEQTHVAGVIFAMIPQQPELTYELTKTIPVVAIGDRRNDLELATVDMNNYIAGQLLGQHLLDLGHRKIAYLSTTLNEHHTSRLRRLEGLRDVISRTPGARLSVLSHDIEPAFELSHLDVEYSTGYQLAERCLKEAPETTALVMVNDMNAYGAYDALAAMGRKIPQDISLAGFDNIFPSRLSSLSLTTVDNSLIECGKSAFQLLQQEMELFQSPSKYQSIMHVEYKCQLKIRNTTGPVKEKEND